MEKLLLASTVLITTAAVASADVILDSDIADTTFLQFGGMARFGIGYLEDRDAANDDISDTILVSRFRLNMDASAETDGGARFTARVRLQADENAAGEADEAKLNGANFSVSYGGLHVAAGNVGGALDNLDGYYGHEVGLEAFAGQYAAINYGFVGYATADTGGNAVFFEYEAGNFAVAAGYDQRSDANDGDRWDVSATYKFGNITAAVGHGRTDAVTLGDDDPSLTVLSLAGKFGDFRGTLLVADDKSGTAKDDGTAYGLSAAYKVGAATLLFTYGDGSADDDRQWIGVGASYALGGGVSLRGGIGRVDQESTEDKMRADFGAHFAF